MELASDAGLEEMIGEVLGLLAVTEVKGDEGEKILVLGSVLKAWLGDLLGDTLLLSSLFITPGEKIFGPTVVSGRNCFWRDGRRGGVKGLGVGVKGGVVSLALKRLFC